jgi:hypothetical protein
MLSDLIDHKQSTGTGAHVTADTATRPEERTFVILGRSWRWPAVAVAGVLAVATVVLWAAPAPIMAPWDVIVLLDGGYRMAEGQIPSTDFSNPVGPLVYGLISLGMRMHGVSLAAVAWGNVLMVLTGSGLTWYATRSRMHLGWRAMATIYAALLLSAVRPLGYSPTITTYAMLYNRYGWVLFTLIVVMVAVRPRRRPTEGLDHIVLGAMLGLLFYTKVTFTLAAGLVILLGLIRSSDVSRLRRLLALIAGFSFVVVVVTALFRVNPVAYIADIADSVLVQSKGRISQMAWGIIWTSPIWMLTAAILVAFLVSARRRGQSLAPVWTLSAMCVAIVAASILLSAGNATERADLVTLAVLPLVITSSVAWQRRGLTTAMAVAVALLLLGTVGTIATQDLTALAKNVALRSYVANPPASQRFDSANLRDFVIPDNSQWNTDYRTAHNVPSMVNDGIRMVRNHARPTDRVFSLAFGSPFNVAMGLQPTEGGMLWYDLGFDIDREHHPSAEEAIGTADWVIIPQMAPNQGCCQETVVAMVEMYGGYLESHFKQIDSSENWILLERVA